MKNNSLVKILSGTLLIIAVSCSTNSGRFNVEVDKIAIDNVKINRYEQVLFSLDKSNLKEELLRIQPDFRIFLDGDLDDTLNLKQLANYINDTLLQDVNNNCQEIYPNVDDLEAEFTHAFKYRKYHYPSLQVPSLFTYVSGFDYEYPIQYFDNSLLIALDMYLGKDYYRYKNLGLPAYLLQNFDKQYIVRDCMRELAKQKIDYKKIGTGLLDMIINEGKIIWYTQAMVPTIADTILLDYSGWQLEWVQSAEGMVWAFLLENEMLYAKDNQLIQKFIYPSPFTSYFGVESPPRLGWFIGWKIVSSYMHNNPDIELPQLMNEYDAQKILQHSGYKPGI